MPSGSRMSDYAVKLKNISKQYKLYSSPWARLQSLFFSKSSDYRVVNALNNISFDIPKGSTFGILGRNGSGKSTILSIIASILKETSGQLEVSGKVTALLELGSGFNPEFSGIDNVYLYASILGLSDEETKERLPEILAFSEIGDFINNPVKTYSSGMMLRLAFSVAIFVNPEILIIDEALSVGDAMFQHKCIQKIKELIAASETTVIFVSHDLTTVQTLCDRAALINNGDLLFVGDAKEAVTHYQKMLFEKEEASKSSLPAKEAKKESQIEKEEQIVDANYQTRFGSQEARILKVEVLNKNQEPVEIISYGETVTINLYVKFATDCIPVYGFSIRNSNGLDVIAFSNEHAGLETEKVSSGDLVLCQASFYNQLQEGHYSVTAAIIDQANKSKMAHYDWVDNASVFNVLPKPEPKFYGVFFPEKLAFKVVKQNV